MIRSLSLLFAISLLLALAPAEWAHGAEYGKISARELKARLGDPGLLIIDVRDDMSWSRGGSKIPGAVREDPDKVDSWAKKYPATREIVLY